MAVHEDESVFTVQIDVFLGGLGGCIIDAILSGLRPEVDAMINGGETDLRLSDFGEGGKVIRVIGEDEGAVGEAGEVWIEVRWVVESS